MLLATVTTFSVTVLFIQATDKNMKTTWVQEIKRCILLNRTDIPEDTKEVLIKSMPTTLDSANQFDNIMNSSKYKSKDWDNISVFIQTTYR